MQLSDLPLQAEVTFQKQRGIVELSEKGLQFVPYNQTSTTNIGIQTIKRQLVNPDSSAKALIKLMIGDPEVAYTFQFHKDMVLQQTTPEAERYVRNRFKDAITLLLAQHSNGEISSNVSLDEFKSRQYVLSNDPQMCRLHAQLVIQAKQLTEEEFWDLPDRTALLQTASHEKGLRKAVDGQFIDDKIKSVSSSSKSGEMKFKLTEDVISNIFLHHPMIKAAYDDNVKAKKISEQDFWTRCLQSAFFNKEKRNKRTKKDDIFDQAFIDETEHIKKPSLTSFLVDINEQEDAAQDYGGTYPSDATMKPGNVQESKQLFRKLNSHADIVLGAQIKNNGTTPKHMQVLREMTQMDDLVQQKVDGGIQLQLNNKSLIKTTTQNGYQNPGQAKKCDNQLGMVNFRKKRVCVGYEEWKQQMVQAAGYENPVSLLPADTYQELVNLNLTMNELLKHFWTQLVLYKESGQQKNKHKALGMLKVIKVHADRIGSSLGASSNMVDFDHYPIDGILNEIQGDSESEVSIKLLSSLLDSVAQVFKQEVYLLQ